MMYAVVHQDNTPVQVTPPYRGIRFFLLIFALKHRFWVLVRTASRVPTFYVLSKNKKKVTFFHLKLQVFTAMKNCSILHGRVIVMSALIV